MLDLRRRQFITLLGGAAAAWPFAARAQQGARRIGIMMNLAADDPEGQARIAAFLQGMQETGWVVGREELPGGGSAGVVLYTADGGLKWRKGPLNELRYSRCVRVPALC